MITVVEVDALSAAAHAGQVDKIGVPYIEHPRAVAAGLVPFGNDLVMAGLLHDVLEDTTMTAADLLAAGVPPTVVGIVRELTHDPARSYEMTIRRIARNRDACLVKIADNAHNSRADRAAKLPAAKRQRLAAKYQAARADLWPAVPAADVTTILERVNPSLLDEFGAAT